MERTVRTIAKCGKCKGAVVAETTEYASGYSAPKWAVCACGAHVQTFAVRGKVSARKCGGACTHAVGPNCSCECGGENHASGWAS